LQPYCRPVQDSGHNESQFRSQTGQQSGYLPPPHARHGSLSAARPVPWFLGAQFEQDPHQTLWFRAVWFHQIPTSGDQDPLFLWTYSYSGDSYSPGTYLAGRDGYTYENKGVKERVSRLRGRPPPRAALSRELPPK